MPNTPLVLSYATVAYNILAGVVSIAFGVITGSPALLGFGIDSFVESLSGAVMVWRFTGSGHENREKTAIRLVGIALMVLAVYVAFEAVTTLYQSEPPERNIAGLIVAAVSL